MDQRNEIDIDDERNPSKFRQVFNAIADYQEEHYSEVLSKNPDDSDDVVFEYSSSEDESSIPTKKAGFLVQMQALKEALKERAKKHFTSSHAVRNGFLIGLLGVIGMVLTGALSGPFALLVFFGVVALTGVMVTAVSGILAFWHGFKEQQRQELSVPNPLTYLVHEFVLWMQAHRRQASIGFLLFLATTALLITALVAPGPLLVAIGFIGSGFGAMGLMLSTPAAAILTFALIGITAMTLLDVAARIWEAVSPPKLESSSLKLVRHIPMGNLGDDSSDEEDKKENEVEGTNPEAYKRVPGTGGAHSSDKGDDKNKSEKDPDNEGSPIRLNYDSD